MTDHIDDRKRWWALIVLCLGELMIVLDTTIVNVALPSIRSDLGFSETSLVWVVNAYMLTFGGFLLLFLLGITLFTLASLACGLSNAQAPLIATRAMQGMGGDARSIRCCWPPQALHNDGKGHAYLRFLPSRKPTKVTNA